MTDLTPREFRSLSTGFCPDCRHVESFVLGPKGGLARNIECRHCKARFNVTRFRGKLVFAERIPKQSEGGSDWSQLGYYDGH